VDTVLDVRIYRTIFATIIFQIQDFACSGILVSTYIVFPHTSIIYVTTCR